MNRNSCIQYLSGVSVRTTTGLKSNSVNKSGTYIVIEQVNCCQVSDCLNLRLLGVLRGESNLVTALITCLLG